MWRCFQPGVEESAQELPLFTLSNAVAGRAHLRGACCRISHQLFSARSTPAASAAGGVCGRCGRSRSRSPLYRHTPHLHAQPRRCGCYRRRKLVGRARQTATSGRHGSGDYGCVRVASASRLGEQGHQTAARADDPVAVLLELFHLRCRLVRRNLPSLLAAS